MNNVERTENGMPNRRRRRRSRGRGRSRGGNNTATTNNSLGSKSSTGNASGSTNNGAKAGVESRSPKPANSAAGGRKKSDDARKSDNRSRKRRRNRPNNGRNHNRPNAANGNGSSDTSANDNSKNNSPNRTKAKDANNSTGSNRSGSRGSSKRSNNRSANNRNANSRGRTGNRHRNGGRNRGLRSNQVRRQAVEQPRYTSIETSAGGLVVSGLAEAVRPDNSVDLSQIYVALIGRLDRRGRLLWSMPKGHVEPGEKHSVTAEREVWEETGVQGQVIEELGVIDYWFVSEGKRIHKTVHHHLLRFVDGELNDEDPEVTEVTWVPADTLIERLAYADERKLGRIAHDRLPDIARAEKQAGRATPR